MAKPLMSEGVLFRTLDWAYGKAVDGLPGLETAKEMATDYARSDGTLRDQANKLIRWQVVKASTSGFVTGLGGLVTMPVTLPANIASVLYVQLRMVAAIAHLGGHDVRSDEVRTFAYACLCGSGVVEMLKGAGIQIGKKLGIRLVGKLSAEVIAAINKKVGFRLLTKFGSKGVINFGRLVPFIGGAIGGTVDGISTNTIGNAARDLFVPTDDPVQRGEPPQSEPPAEGSPQAAPSVEQDGA
jgi:EcsC protein family